MLVLTRKIAQRIFIGDTITVTVIDVGQGKVRLGIEAPADVPVWREEIATANALPVGEPRAVTDWEAEYPMY